MSDYEPWWRQVATRRRHAKSSEEELLAEIRLHNARILKRRKGLPLEDSLPLIHQDRDERSEHIARLLFGPSID